MGAEHFVEELDVLAARLAKGRRLAHLSRSDLATESGVEIEVVERMETGRVVPDEDQAKVLAVLAEHTTAEALHIPRPRSEASLEWRAQTSEG